MRIVAAKMMHLSRENAGDFYFVHRDRPFFQELVEYMSSGPVMVQVLEGENAIHLNRDLMGATFPKDAKPGTIRADFCDVEGDQGQNAVHGSDSPETAKAEISFFFIEEEIFPRSR